MGIFYFINTIMGVWKKMTEEEFRKGTSDAEQKSRESFFQRLRDVDALHKPTVQLFFGQFLNDGYHYSIVADMAFLATAQRSGRAI